MIIIVKKSQILIIRMTKHELVLKMTFKNANIYRVKNTSVAVVEASGVYITIEEFKSIFGYMSNFIITHKIQKLVFDKRELMVFHQQSMRWHFIEWKEKMFDHNLIAYRYILPKDPEFRSKVKKEREHINKIYEDSKFHKMDIKYSDTLNDAIEN